jgi:homoserine dehydrogenase
MKRLVSSCRIALLGFGTVGSAVARRLVSASTNLQLTHVFDRRATAKRDLLTAPGVAWTTCIDEVLESDADVVVEAVGGVEPAAGWIRTALLAGKSVVTANKQVMARHGAALLTLAARQGRQLRFEAAVGGAMPIVRAIGDGLAGDRITRVAAILNGTTNAVLSRMEATRCTMAEALGDARARGLAEADPSADLDGEDAAVKLAILCALAFALRVDPAQIDVRSASGITREDVADARADGGVIRQIAQAEYDALSATLSAWVAPVTVPRGSIFANTTGPGNAAIVTAEHSGETVICGTGAGGAATAVAILSDLAAIARDRAAVVPAPILRSDFVVRPSNERRTANAERRTSNVGRRTSNDAPNLFSESCLNVSLAEAV